MYNFSVVEPPVFYHSSDVVYQRRGVLKGLRHSGWGQLPLSLKAKLNRTVLTWKFPALNVYLLVEAFTLSQSWPHPVFLACVSLPSHTSLSASFCPCFYYYYYYAWILFRCR